MIHYGHFLYERSPLLHIEWYDWDYWLLRAVEMFYEPADICLQWWDEEIVDLDNKFRETISVGNPWHLFLSPDRIDFRKISCTKALVLLRDKLSHHRYRDSLPICQTPVELDRFMNQFVDAGEKYPDVLDRCFIADNVFNLGDEHTHILIVFVRVYTTDAFLFVS